MANIPRVFTSGERVATVDGVDVHLLTVEPAGDHVCVRMIGAATDHTRRLVAEHRAVMDDWSAHHRAGEKRPPASPAERVFDSLTLRLDDGAGTRFHPESGSAGGTGTELRCEWIFVPGAAPDAERLTLSVTSPDGTATAHTFDVG